MKKVVFSWLLGLAIWNAAWAGSCPIKLDISAMGASVEEVLIIRRLDTFTSTNSVTPAEGVYEDAIIADSISLVAKLKPGYKNARFAYHTDQYGEVAATSGFISSGSTVPFLTAEPDTVVIATFVTELLVDPETYTLNFNANGGEVSPTSKTITFGAPYGELPTPTRQGHAFGGWTGEGRIWTSGDPVETLTNQTFIAAWTPHTYTVTFEPNGGSGTMEPQSFTYDQAQVLRANGFTLDNYHFSCWSNRVTGITYPNQASVKNLTDVQNGEVVLTAVWAAKAYSIRYHRNYSPADNYYDAAEISYGATATLREEYSRLGYAFSGWALTSTAAMPQYSAKAPVSTRDFTFDENGVLNLYAVWDAYSYTVQFLANGGEGTMDAVERGFDDGQALPACAFTRNGFKFSGWSTSATGAKLYDDGATDNLATQDGKTVKLYAVWVPVSYTIAFDANDAKATGVMESRSATYNVLQNLPACEFAKDGYDFTGWATAADGAVVYSNQVVVVNLASVQGAVVTLYACWKAQSYKVLLNANGGRFMGGSATTSNITVTVDAPYGEFPTVTNETPKLVFGDWRTPAGEVVSIADLAPPPSAGVTNLVAHWVKDDPLAQAVDAEELDFNSANENGFGNWRKVEDASAVGGDCAYATITSMNNEDILKLTTKVVGSGTLIFKWRVLSGADPYLVKGSTMQRKWEWTPDRLFFSCNGVVQTGVAGTAAKYVKFTQFSGGYPTAVSAAVANPGWTEESLRIEAAAGSTNVLTWTFHCNIPEAGVIGQAWVDDVRWQSDTDVDEETLRPVGIDGKSPIAIESNADGTVTVKAGVANGAKGYWYAFYTATELQGPWEVVSSGYERGTPQVQMTATDTQTLEFAIVVRPGENRRFYKLVVSKDPVE